VEFFYCDRRRRGVVAFDVWGLCCLLFEEKKGLIKVNLLLPLPTSILDKVVLGCFWVLGLEMLRVRRRKVSWKTKSSTFHGLWTNAFFELVA
jgi:hypothetical protein